MQKVIFWFTLSILSGCNNGSHSTVPKNNASAAKQPIAALADSAAIPILDSSSSLGGIDADMNGIRDDIDLYIEQLAISHLQKKAVEQLAKSVQASILLKTADHVALRAVNQNISAAVQCLSTQFPNIQQRSQMLTAIESKTANTKARTDKYIQFNHALSGSVSTLLSGDTCHE